ncbi:MAG: hypothetical protein JKY96_00050 [Phycisphaerales bacterium]|nr:hypothetical protein [Phycisphaerales bacterium]
MSTYENNENYLAGSPQAEMNDLLNDLGHAERSRAPAGLESGVLDAIAKQVAPASLSIEQTPRISVWFSKTLKYSAAAALVLGVGVATMMTRPWQAPITTTDTSMISVMFQEDIESFLALDELDSEIDESVAELSIWAHALDSEFNDSWMALDLMESSLDTNGAL